MPSLSAMNKIRFIAWLHACLHKIEGDEFNSRYWYSGTGHSYQDFATPEIELHAIRAALLSS